MYRLACACCERRPQCFCGGQDADYDSLGEDVCDFACSGDSSQTCGGYYTVEVFALDGATTATVSSPTDTATTTTDTGVDTGTLGNDFTSDADVDTCLDQAAAVPAYEVSKVLGHR